MNISRLGLAWLVVLLALTSARPARAQDARAAEQFVRATFARYDTQKDFAPFFDLPTVRSLATPGLTALVQRDQALSQQAQEPGALDFDPLSGSQDSTGLKLAGVEVASDQPGQALATVRVKFPDGGNHRRRLVLAAVKGKWRIDNILGEDGAKDLRTLLSKSIAENTKAPAKR